MTKYMLSDSVTPAESEISVRAYHCTYYKSRLLGLSASGYLEVTNKRVIFQALGNSSAGVSIIHSEVPVADVSGLSSYKGTYFSLGHIAMAFVAAFIAFSITPIIITLTAQLTRNFSMLTSIGWAVALISLIISFFIPNQSIWRSVIAAVSVGAFSAVGSGSLFTGFFGGGNQGMAGLSILIGFIVAIYALVCFFWYSRRPTFSLSVNSKGGSSTPINISGATGIGIFDVAAGKALTAEPAEEAEKLLKELGAIVLDVQTLGDLGISKWKSA